MSVSIPEQVPDGRRSLSICTGRDGLYVQANSPAWRSIRRDRRMTPIARNGGYETKNSSREMSNWAGHLFRVSCETWNRLGSTWGAWCPSST